jgi:hypothetical protein
MKGMELATVEKIISDKSPPRHFVDAIHATQCTQPSRFRADQGQTAI